MLALYATRGKPINAAIYNNTLLFLLSAWYNSSVAMEKVVKEIVELFHKRDKGINNYDETYEL
jgi:hypothetical protein